MKTKSLEILEKAQLPAVQARAILQVMEVEFATEALATKADLYALEARLDARMEAMATKAEVAELRSEMYKGKADLMRWMFVFWVGQMAATLAIVKYLK